MRMVIDAASARNGGANTPIRLITSQGIVQIVLRRKVCMCWPSLEFVLASMTKIAFQNDTSVFCNC